MRRSSVAGAQFLNLRVLSEHVGPASSGRVADPHTRETCRNLPLAKQTIDISGHASGENQGNLDSDEDNLLSNILYELRMKYVAASKNK
jgi:hypothetical protein